MALWQAAKSAQGSADADPDIEVDHDELEDARWFTRAEMREQAEAGALVLPGGVSISRSLVEHWYGGPLPGHW